MYIIYGIYITIHTIYRNVCIYINKYIYICMYMYIEYYIYFVYIIYVLVQLVDRGCVYLLYF